MIIGIDVGGTNLKLGVIDKNKIIERIVLPTDKNDVVSQLILNAHKLIDKYKLDDSSLKGIGVGCPGIIIDGVVRKSANLNLFNCNLQSILTDEFKCKVAVKNDADMATLGEQMLGGAKGAKNVIMLTIGTGVGGGIIINNTLYEGRGGAGELGHVTMYKDGIECNCGRKGCAEKYLSAIALSNRAKVEMKLNNIPFDKNAEVKASYLVSQTDLGVAWAKKVIDEYAEDLSEYVLNLCNIFRPDTILIGGGLSYAPSIIDKVASLCKIKHFGYPNSQEVCISSAKLGNDAGILGALIVTQN